MKEARVQFVAYDQIKDTAIIGFISPKGKLKSLNIHRITFSRLMSGELDKSTIPGDKPSTEQQELRDEVKNEIKKNYDSWFKEETTKISKAACDGKY